MKALKNDSTIYTEQIVSAITECYSKNEEPSNGELMQIKLKQGFGRAIRTESMKN